MELRELPGDARAAGPEDPGGGGERLAQAMRRLEPDERLPALGQALQEAPPLALPGRQETQEDVRDGRQARDGQGRGRGGGARHDARRDARRPPRRRRAARPDPRAPAFPRRRRARRSRPRESRSSSSSTRTPRAARGRRSAGRRGRTATRASRSRACPRRRSRRTPRAPGGRAAKDPRGFRWAFRRRGAARVFRCDSRTREK